MKSTNELIKNFDYSEAHIDLLQENLIKELDNLPIIQMKFHKGRAIYRCRKLTSINERFFYESDISYRRDSHNIKQLGRCNFYNQTKFYGSIASEKVSNGYITSIFETSSLLRDKKDGYEVYTIGMWVANEDIDLFAVMPTPEMHKNIDIYKELQSIFDKHFQDKNATAEQKEFHELLSYEMSKVVKSNENHKYCISSIVSEMLLQKQIGIVYPSVQTESNGLNVVFNPMNFDKHFTLKSVLVGDFYKFKNDSMFRNLYTCENASLYPFKYVDADPNYYVSIEQLVEFFNGKGISPDYIISKLIEQNNKL